ncbi:peptidylprolyl isomerase [Pseudoduganella violacea]|uniref:peptidylprolyl isomerase n=1 Tax=Pseudoduganella violacea TaxID=1715466 RepID=A0A7W5BBA9_9BURK|nr:peptidylprolyl isomerase [Pseudoduganella violacea]MBB3119971.1 peptidyl-prolyl cis-trans isomerase C [Pseudoduganella violacea]
MILKPARLLIALTAIAAAPVMAQTLATVNGKAIPQARLDAAVKQVVAQSRQPDSPQLREMIKKDLIAREVLIQEADKQGFGTKPEVKAALDNARQSIIINAMWQEYLKKNPVKEADVKAEYEKFKASRNEKEYHARHILVGTEKEATDIIAKLKAGGKFEELAKVSKDGSANNGGDLGWATPSTYVQPFSEAMVALKDGQVTDKPVQSQFGFHVIKLEGSRAGKVPSYEELKERVEEALTQRKIATYREELMKKAKIQ